MQKVVGLLSLLLLSTTCKLIEDRDASNLTSFRRNANGDVTVAIGIFMNRYPSVIDGEFFPYELYKGEVAELAEGEFKGFAADVITGKHPFEGFKNPAALEKAKARSPQDPYHFDGYYLKIMVVDDAIAPLPDEVDLHRGFFPHNFYCSAGQESVEIKGDDRALGNPQGDHVLGSPNWTARAARTITFCKAKEVNGPYAGRDFYYTRVSLFAEDANRINELLDDSLDLGSEFAKHDSQYHETISALAKFRHREGGETFSETATVINLNHNVVPAVLELHELLRQNSTVDLSAIVDSTDKVQHYLHDNRNRAHDANWQVLLLAQRKWLAIRMIIEDMRRQANNKAEQLRAAVFTSLEVADVRDMLPMTTKLAEYRSAADYINALRHSPAATVDDQGEKDIFFGATSHQHFNRLIYHIAIASTARQWESSRRLYRGEGTDSILIACSQHCPEQEKEGVREIITKAEEKHAGLQPFAKKEVHDAWMKYVSAVNTIYPDAARGARAEFKKKYVVVGNAIDYENSSSAYKDAYQRYARRYDLVFAEPHGLLMGTEAFLGQMGEKRQPENVHIFKSNGQLQYDWIMHPYVQYNTIDTALTEMREGIYKQAVALHKLAQEIHQHTPDAEQQITLTAKFAEHYQIIPLAKALLIRPDYAVRMNAVFKKHTRFRVDHFLRDWGFPAVSIAATVAALALSIPTVGGSLPALPALLPGVLYGTGTAAGLLASAAQFQYGRVVQQRAESSLFADNFGTNFDEYYRARQEYRAAQRALHFDLALTVFDAAEFVKFAYRVGKSARQIKAMTSFLGDDVAKGYREVFKKLKYCSAPECRRFIHSVPLLTAKADNAALRRVLDSLKEHTGDIKKFKEAVRSLWMGNNVDGAFDVVIRTEFIDDVLRARFFPLTDIRIPFVQPKLRGMPEVKRVALSQLLDDNAVKGMRDSEVLDLFGALVYGRKHDKKFIAFSRNPASKSKLLGKKLGLDNKELKKLYEGDEELAGLIKNKDKKEIKKWLEKKREELKAGNARLIPNELTDGDVETIIALHKNKERVTLLKANFAQMLGKVAKVDKLTLEGTGRAVSGETSNMVPGLVSRSPSRLLGILGIQKDAVEQVANNRKWSNILAANDDVKRDLLGELVRGDDGKAFRQGGKLQELLEKINDLSVQAFDSYQRR